MEKHTEGTTNEQEGSEGVMISLNRWVASPDVMGNYILCVTPTGAVATATPPLRDRGGVKN